MQRTEHQATVVTIPAARMIRRRIGNTTYNVTVHFSQTSRETMNDKILRPIKNEASSGKAAGL
jgi:hypothetical protein